MGATSGTGDGADFIIGAHQPIANTDKEFFRIKNNGNVGIGTTTPGQLLEVSGGNLKVSSTTTSITAVAGSESLLTISPPSAAAVSFYGTKSTATSASAQTITSITGSYGAGTFTGPAGTLTNLMGGQFVANVSGGANTATNVYGSSSKATILSNTNVTSSYGAYGESNPFSVTGSIANSYGVFGRHKSQGSSVPKGYGGYFTADLQSGGATGSTLYGAFGSASHSTTGVATAAYGLYGEVKTASTGTITDAFGMYTDVTRPTGTITNGYGIYVGNVQATNKFSIYASDSTAPIYLAGNVGIGTTAPSSPLSVTPDQYSTGTASQALTTVTGVGTTWTSAMVGSQLVFANGVSAGTIMAFGSATSLTVTASQTVAAQAYKISYTGLQVSSNGDVSIGQVTPHANFHVNTVTATANQPQLLVSNYYPFAGTSAAGIGFANTDDKNSYPIKTAIYSTGNGAFAIGDLRFAINSVADFSPVSPTTDTKMTIATNGNVGVGTTTPNSLLHVAGPISTAVSAQVNTYTILATDSVVLATPTVNTTYILPTPVGITGRQYTIKNLSATSTITLSPAAGLIWATTSSATTYVIPSAKTVTVVSNGTDWYIIGGF